MGEGVAVAGIGSWRPVWLHISNPASTTMSCDTVPDLEKKKGMIIIIVIIPAPEGGGSLEGLPEHKLPVNLSCYLYVNPFFFLSRL